MKKIYLQMKKIVDRDKESIESIPFIAEPSKDKRSRSNK